MVIALLNEIEKDVTLTQKEKDSRRSRLLGVWFSHYKELKTIEKVLLGSTNPDPELILRRYFIYLNIMFAYLGKTPTAKDFINARFTQIEDFVSAAKEKASLMRASDIRNLNFKKP